MNPNKIGLISVFNSVFSWNINTFYNLCRTVTIIFAVQIIKAAWDKLCCCICTYIAEERTILMKIPHRTFELLTVV